MIVFYVSGHGYGHATRTGAIVDAVCRLAPDVPVAVRSQAPEWAFPNSATYWHTEVDFTVAEGPDALSLDCERTRENVQSFCAALPDILQAETLWLQRHGARLLVADMPFLPGLLSKRISVPAIAIGNFTWHWILETIMPWDGALTVISEAYSHFAGAFRLPLSSDGGWAPFPACTDVPLVTPLRSSRSRPEIRRQLGLVCDSRPTVLVAGRSGAAAEALAIAGTQSPDVDFLVRADPGLGALPPNVFRYAEERVSFSDALRASSAVLSKLGYSTAAECIAEGKRLLYPSRTDFRESEILPEAVSRYIPARGMTKERYFSGQWRLDLERLFGQALPTAPHIDVAGAEACARMLLRTANGA